jgi:uracil-DNA glycosylase
MRTILVGEAPPQSRPRDTPTSLPFSGASGKRFSDMLGVDVTEVFETRNLISIWPGKSSKGSLFPLALARAGMRDLMRELETRQLSHPQLAPSRLILAGTRVATVFHANNLPRLEWHTVWFAASMVLPYEISIIPHPSGVSRAWNDPDMVERVQRFLLEEKERMEHESE